jgi:hypothetical protein
MIHDEITHRERTGPIHLVEETEDQRRISALEEAFASAQKRGWALLIAVVTALGGVGIYLQQRAHSAGALEQKIIDLEDTVKDAKDTIKSLREDIKEIRGELIRRSAIDPPPRAHPPTSDMPDPYNKLSLFTQRPSLCSRFEF